MPEKKSKGELLKEKLLIERKNMGETLSEQELRAVYDFCEPYKDFLTRAKTEREAVAYISELLEKNGYAPFAAGKNYKTGEKFYFNNRNKALIAVTMGSLPLSEGVHIAASHIDSPRLDLKPRPLYEEAQLAYFKTHYYGGLKKYQWSAIPLSLHGVVVKKNGASITVTIGEDPGDPVFCVTDLLPHLAKEQMQKTMSEGLTGEQLNILIGCQMFPDEKVCERVKLNIANILFEKYDILEEDFLSAELCAVPAYPARDVGLDRGMIGSYGHDDRVCAYCCLMAEIGAKNPKHTTVTVFADKEETGSDGVTGTNSMFLMHFLEDLAAMQKTELRQMLRASQCLSADVNVAFDPAFPDTTERNNVAYLNYGAVLTKYTGARGKSDTNDAPAEVMSTFRKLLDEAGVVWQTGELGKVDQGGGGTVAKYISYHDIDTVDLGVPVLSMHAPFEIVSKADVYMTFRAVAAFYAK